MSHSPIFQGSRVQLVSQLVHFDEEKIHFLDQYFPDHCQKRNTVDKKISAYCSTLEGIMNDLTEERLESIVLIGSQVDLLYLDDGSTESFTIVFPHRANPDRSLISFLSPLGFQLLMAQTKEQYQLVIPSGEMSVRVEGVKFMNHGDVN
ncbi:GreA/GreB family elongation factor [Brevibacillus dissolubilis]|uniref:GreA/GreB family elongation factor n=1 Tax=Brevibacillus dissolubilis TaxID=1844116 RepID=UPI00159BCB6E|nr:GreA/GreB family elongation factor [Brevibacillus dissolubilis]